MIHMPHRSVTRFFIPLIDVMLLLFCVFLLMPIANEKTAENEVKHAQKTIDMLNQEIDSLRKRLARLEDVKAGKSYQEIERMQREIERLQEQLKKQAPERTHFVLVDIDGDNGEIFFFDPNADMPKHYFKNKDQVQAFMDTQKKMYPDRQRYYFFLYPRGSSDWPLAGQVRQYREWFKDVPNSLKGARP